MEAAFIFYMNSLFTVPFLCIFMMSILILFLPLNNLRGDRNQGFSGYFKRKSKESQDKLVDSYVYSF